MVQTFSQVVSMSAWQAQGHGFNPHWQGVYIGAMSETNLGLFGLERYMTTSGWLTWDSEDGA